MKKSIITVCILFFAVFTTFGQSITLVPTSSNQVSLRTYGSQIASFSGYHSEGSSSSPTATLNNKILAGMYGYGYGGSFFNSTPNASIEFRAYGNFNIINNGAEILFNTTPFNSAFVRERMRIANNGNVGIGTATPQTMLEVKTDADNYGIQHTDGNVTLSTYASTTFGAYLGTRSNHPLRFYVNSGATRLQIETGGNVVVTDFTKLGSDAPAIKHKLITGYNTPSSEGGGREILIPHGLNSAKILDVSITAQVTIEGGSNQIPPSFRLPAGQIELEYSYMISPTYIELYTNNSSANILSKPVKILITYME